MKNIIALIAFASILVTSGLSQTAGQVGIQRRKADNSGFETVWFTLGNDKVIASDGSGNLVAINKSSLGLVYDDNFNDNTPASVGLVGFDTGTGVMMQSTGTTVGDWSPTSVLAGSIGSDAVGSDQVINNSIESIDILDGGITSDDIASDAITSAHIIDGTITGTDVDVDTLTSYHILGGSILAEDLAGEIGGDLITDESIGGVDIADGSITGPDISFDAVESIHIFDGTVSTDDIQDGSVSAVDMNSSDNFFWAGTHEFQNGIFLTSGGFEALGLPISAGTVAAQTLTLWPMTYTDLTALAPAVGDLAVINDAQTPSYRATVTGGGTDVVLVMWDGTNWICH